MLTKIYVQIFHASNCRRESTESNVNILCPNSGMRLLPAIIFHILWKKIFTQMSIAYFDQAFVSS